MPKEIVYKTKDEALAEAMRYKNFFYPDKPQVKSSEKLNSSDVALFKLLDRSEIISGY
jgi:hypothetical protein